MSTSPPPGEPGQKTTSPELLYSLFRSDEAVAPAQPPMAERPRRWRVPAVPVLAALIAVVLMSGVVVAVGHDAAAEAGVAAAAVDSPVPVVEELPLPPTTVTTQAIAAAPAPRTRPVPPPANPTAPAPIVKIGEIRIPKIGLVHPIYEGVTLTVIDHGPGHWPGSAVPGQLGNAVFAGHRVTHTHPFRNVDKLVPGDEIQFVMPDGTYTYRMTQQQIVTPNDTWIVNPTQTATLTLFACHPPGSATNRIVIRADYVGKS
ncbi:MAG: sortase [Actinomycetota bacterium]|nr:sortase [Actinomycetota bacterium]MDQ1497984.1 sortase [Actinomycetota bacterium]